MRSNPCQSLFALVSIAVIASCSTSSGTTNTQTVSKVAGDTQRVVAGTAVTIDPSVKVVDDNGAVVAGVGVVFAVTGGGGSVASGATVTGSNGIATSGNWTLGTAGGANTLTASVAGASGSPVTFTATGLVVSAITKYAGDGQIVAAHTQLPIAPAVKVVDGSGNPVAGVSVTFFVASGGGVIQVPQVSTDANGIASVGSWLLGVTPGSNTLTAFVAGNAVTGNPVTFTATGQ